MKSDIWRNFCLNFDFTVKAHMICNSLYHRNFQMKTDMNEKTGSYTKFLYAEQDLASKMPNLKNKIVPFSHLLY